MEDLHDHDFDARCNVCNGKGYIEYKGTGDDPEEITYEPCDCADFDTCICGSGKEPWDLVDARGIYVSQVCSDCEQKVKAKYRPDIFEDPNYPCEEQVYDDY